MAHATCIEGGTSRLKINWEGNMESLLAMARMVFALAGALALSGCDLFDADAPQTSTRGMPKRRPEFKLRRPTDVPLPKGVPFVGSKGDDTFGRPLRRPDAADAMGIADPELGPHLEAWVEASPKSVAALTCRGKWHFAMTWHERGSGTSAETSDKQFAAFRGRSWSAPMLRAGSSSAMSRRKCQARRAEPRPGRRVDRPQRRSRTDCIG